MIFKKARYSVCTMQCGIVTAKLHTHFNNASLVLYSAHVADVIQKPNRKKINFNSRVFSTVSV